jgi:hypothetical protein
MSIYVTTAAGQVIMGIYDASGRGGSANVLKATTNSFTPTTGWNTVNVVTPVWLPAGNYWLAWNSNNNSLQVSMQNQMVMQNGTIGTEDDYSVTYGALPNPPSGSPSTYENTDAVYATFTGAGCASPTGKERDIIYNGGSHTLQFRNGDMWLNMGQGSGGGGCSSPAGKERCNVAANLICFVNP